MTLPYRVVIDGHDDAPFSSAALALAALEAVEPTGRYAYIDALHRDGVFRPVACVNSPREEMAERMEANGHAR